MTKIRFVEECRNKECRFIKGVKAEKKINNTFHVLKNLTPNDFSIEKNLIPLSAVFSYRP